MGGFRKVVQGWWSRPMVLKVCSQAQQHPHCPGTRKKCRLLGSPLTYCIRNSRDGTAIQVILIHAKV